MDVSIATITWARTSDEEALLRRSLPRLVAIGLPLVVADGGSSESFRRFLDQPGVHICAPAAPGLVHQVQAAVSGAAAFGTSAILYTEPDKDDFFAGPLRGFLDRAAEAPGDLVIAARSEASFATYPPTQRYAEGVINRLCGDAFGVGGDYSYGPFVMPQTLAVEVTRLRAELGWGWRHAVFAAARRSGVPIRHVIGDHPCPADQRGEDSAERGHRLRQLSQNIGGLID